MRRPTKQRRFGSTLVELIILGGLIVAGGVIWTNRQDIADSLRALNYHPSSDMRLIEDKLQLTSRGQQIFAASDAELDNATTFNQDCDQAKETNNPILGCYAGDRIFVYNVTSKELAGIKETTAAHELLHAVYARMNAVEKSAINKEVEAAYQKVKTPELEARMAYYQKSEPGQEDNELHSILGTEFHNLGPDLEKHYSEYFKNRQTLVSFHDQYSAVFTSLHQKSISLERQINSLAETINQQTVNYNTSIKQLNADISTFEQKNNNGGYTSQAEFTTDRNNLIYRSDQLDAQRTAIEDDIRQYNELINQYNAIATQTNALNTDINSTLAAPSPSI